MTEAFDEAYFERYYGSQKTRVYGKKEIGHLARAITEMIAYFDGDLASVLDVGAGTGLFGQWFRRHKPAVSYVSTDISAHACEKYGHELRDIATWRGRKKYDLVICQGVLPYLSDEACASAIGNLAGMSRGFLYLEAVTAKDLKEVCDRDKTDVSMRARPASFYKALLAKSYVPLGCGLHYVKTGPLSFYELEASL